MRRGHRLLCLLATRSCTTCAAELTLLPGWPSVAELDETQVKRLTFIRHAEGWHNKDGREKANYYSVRLRFKKLSCD